MTRLRAHHLVAVALALSLGACTRCGGSSGTTETSSSSSSGFAASSSSSSGATSQAASSSSSSSGHGGSSSVATSGGSGGNSSSGTASSSGSAGTSQGVTSSSAAVSSSSAAPQCRTGCLSLADGGCACPDADGGVTCNGQPVTCSNTNIPYCASNGTGFCCGTSFSTICEVFDAGSPCWSNGINCNSVQLCNGSWSGCYGNLEGHCPSTGSLLCCDPGSVVCADGCHPAGWVCGNLVTCTDGGPLQSCSAGNTPHCESNGSLTCCPASYPVYCAGSGCWSTGTDCANSATCPLPDGGTTTRPCTTGDTPHCGTHGDVFCCGGNYPVYCEGSGCWSPGTDCATVTTCALQDGGTVMASCGTGDMPHCATSGDLYCCPPNFPQFCQSALYTSCWSANTDCNTITACPEGDGSVRFLSCFPGAHVDCALRSCVNN